MKTFKRFLIFFGILAILLVGAAVVIPIIFKDELVAIVKDGVNENINAKLDFGQVNLSVLRSFPNLSFKIEDISLTGIEEFDELPLAKIKTFDLQLDLLSVLQKSKPILIKSIDIQQPEIQVLVLNNGKANYDIAKSTGSSSEASSQSGVYKFKLNKYNIANGRVLFEDHSSKLHLLIDQLEHNGSGAFDTNIFDLNADTKVGGLSLIYDQIHYLKNAKINWTTTLGIDQKQNLYAIKENSLSVNALILKLDGFLQMLDQGLKLNMNLSAPENEFKNLLSLIPNAYIQDFEEVESSGNFILEAYANGVYQFDQSQYPPFNLKLDINKGFVKYPGLPLAIDQIATNINVNSPSSDFDDIRIEAPKISWAIDGNPFLASFFLKKPLSDPDFETSLNGKLDLEDLKKALPGYLEEEMAGQLDIAMSLEAKLSEIEREEYDKLQLLGTLNAQNVKYPLENYGYPLLSIDRANVLFSPQKATISQLNARAGQSDLSGSGQINNLLAYFSPEKTMTGTFNLKSDFINADEWYPANPTGNPIDSINFIDTTHAPVQERPFDRFDFAVEMQAEKIKYSIYQLDGTIAQARVKPNEINVQNVFTKIKDSDFSTSGRIDNVFDYLYNKGTLEGQLSLQSSLININSLYSTDDNTAQASTASTASNEEAAFETPSIPENIEIQIQTDVQEVKYAEISFKELAGLLNITDQAAVLENMNAKGLGGDILLSGQYDTKDTDKPYFSMKYDLKRLDFVESFKSANTYRKLNPIAEFIEGKYNTTLILEGQLGKNMYPVFSTLNAQGFFETIEGLIKGLQPLEKIGGLLKIEELQNAVKIKDTRNFFELKEGFMEVKPFDIVVSDIKMNISGRHSIDQNLDYVIQARVPRAMLEESDLGSIASNGISLLEKQAQSLGIKVEQAPFINLGISVKGAVQQPDVGIKVLGLSKEDGTLVASADSTSTKAGEIIDQKIEEGKEEIKEEAQQAVDSAKVLANEKAEAAKDTLNQKADELKKQAEDKAKEILGQGDTTTVDSIKQALEKWNPFKKKKKKNNN